MYAKLGMGRPGAVVYIVEGLLRWCTMNAWIVCCQVT